MSELLHDRVRIDQVGPVLTATLARPDAGNALDLPMALAIQVAAERINRGAHDGSVRAAIIGADGRAFSVGGDLRAVAESDDRKVQMQSMADAIHSGLLLLTSSPVPVITTVQGVAAGGGVGLALSGDIVLASTAAKFRLAYTAAGLSPDCGASWILPRRIGLARAMDLGLTNRVVTAAEAAAWGMVSRVVEPDELAGEAEALASSLSTGSRTALAETKRLLWGGATESFADHLDDEGAAIATLTDSPDGTEGVDAFLAKRQPKFA